MLEEALNLVKSRKGSLSKSLSRRLSTSSSKAEDVLLSKSRPDEELYTWRESRALLLHGLKGDYALSVEEKTRLSNSLRRLVAEKDVAALLSHHFADELVPEAMAHLAGKISMAEDRNAALLGAWVPLFLHRLPQLEPLLAALVEKVSGFDPRRAVLVAFRNDVLLATVDASSIDAYAKEAEWRRMLGTLAMLGRDGSSKDASLDELLHPGRPAPNRAAATPTAKPKPAALAPSHRAPGTPKATRSNVPMLRSPGAPKTVRWVVWGEEAAEEAEANAEPLRRHSMIPISVQPAH